MFLEDVSQREEYSLYQSVTQGVPQDSVLCPLFYIMYTNDLTKIVKNCKIAMYADDTAVRGMQKDLDALARSLKGVQQTIYYSYS